MTETNIAATARFYDLGGAIAPPVPSRVELFSVTLADGAGAGRFQGLPGPLAFIDLRVHYGLMEAVEGVTRSGLHWIGIRMLGDGVVTAHLKAAAIGVIGVPGEANSWSFKLDGVELARVDQFTPCAALCGWGTHIDDTEADLPVTAGGLFTGEFGSEGIPSFLAVDDLAEGTPGSTFLVVEGDLTPPGVAPGQPPMRLHGAVVDTY